MKQILPINKCLVRKVGSISLIAGGLTLLVLNLLSMYAVSPLLGIGMVVVGLSWLMKRQMALVALSIPAMVGLEGLAGLATGVTLAGSLGLVWLSALRFLEDYHV